MAFNFKNIQPVFLSAFVLNLIWEGAHSPLYICSFLPGQTLTFDKLTLSSAVFIILAAVADAIIITAIILLLSALKDKYSSLKKLPKFDYMFVLAAGILAAVIIEIGALTLGSWSYKEAMPTILGIGLSPLVQLSITGSTVLFLSKSKRFA